MKKAVLTVALLITACNLAAGIAYAATCESRTGARLCGKTCTPVANGGCDCTGECTAAERKWVDGAGGFEIVDEPAQ